MKPVFLLFFFFSAAFHCFFARVSATLPSIVVSLKKSERLTNSLRHDLTVQHLSVGSYLAASRM